jgi:N-acyl-phosphatidylethanolamine-hydrolysing phospholipase D
LGNFFFSAKSAHVSGQEMLKFTWVGGPTFLLEMGTFKFLTDPMFSDGPQAFIMHGHPSTGEETAAIARLAPVPAVDLAAIDGLLVSHLHSDHFDAGAVSRLDKNVVALAASEHISGIKERGFPRAHPLDWWETQSLSKGDEKVTLTALPARHALDDILNTQLGVVNGYLLEYQEGNGHYRIFWTGDTVWFDDLASIQHRMGSPDMLIPHLGAVGRDGPYGRMTLNAAEAVRLIELFKPEVIIPIHHHTFSHYVEPVDVLQAKLFGTRYERCLHTLREGETFTLKERRPFAPSIKIDQCVSRIEGV